MCLFPALEHTKLLHSLVHYQTEGTDDHARLAALIVSLMIEGACCRPTIQLALTLLLTEIMISIRDTERVAKLQGKRNYLPPP